MKPLFLTIDDSSFSSPKRIDFTEKTANIPALSNEDINNLKEYLKLGFYGNGKQGNVELSYEYNGEEYTVKRNFNSGMAVIKYAEGNTICEGVEEVNKLIMSHIKLNAETFDKLLVIDRDGVLDGFMQSEEERDQYVGKWLDDVLCDKAEISLIEQKVKEKYDKTVMQIELTEEVDPQELANLKEEIKQKEIIRHDISTEMTAMTEEIAKGEAAARAAAELEIEKDLLKKAQDKSEVVAQLRQKLQISEQAELMKALTERKQIILQRDEELKKKIEQLNQAVAMDEESIAKGQKSVKDLEETLIHCLERLNELRKILYDKVSAVFSNEEYQDKIKKQLDAYFNKEAEELELLKNRKLIIKEELEALHASYKDISERIKQIRKDADVKKAIREGAVLESQKKELEEILSSTKEQIEKTQSKINSLNDLLEKSQAELNKDILKFTEIERLLKGSFGDIEQALEFAEKAEEEVLKNIVLINTYEKDIVAIDKKIEENVIGLNEYKEDMEALNGAKEGLIAFINKHRQNLSFMEDRFLKLKAEYNRLNQINDLEYGEACPLCNSVILDKKYADTKPDAYQKELVKLDNEIKKTREILAEYDDKLHQLNVRTGELSARIKISEAYIASLRQNKKSKADFISNAVIGMRAKSSAEISARYGEIKERADKLKKAKQEYDLLKTKIENAKNYTEFLKEEKRQAEEEQLKKLIQNYKEAADKLNDCQKKHQSILKVIDSSESAIKQMEELAILEKEYDTLNADLAQKRERINILNEELLKVEEFIAVLDSDKKRVEIDGKRYDYKTLAIRECSKDSEEIVSEIRKSEEEAEQIKVELTAVRKVLNEVIERKNNAMAEINRLQARLDSDQEILKEIMDDYERQFSSLNTDNAEDIKKLILSDEEKEKAREESKAYYDALAIHSSNIDKLQSFIEENKESYKMLEEHKVNIGVLRKRYEEVSAEIAEITARRAEMKSRAKQLFALKEKYNKYQDKLKVLGEVVRLINKNGDIPNFIIKLSSKRIYSLTKGKYNLEIENGKLTLLNNSEGGKAIAIEDCSKQEKLLVSLVLGTSFYRTLIDMIGGEPLMLIFTLRDKEADKDIAPLLAEYALKKSLIFAAEEGALKKLKK
ncbi:MAG: hypothetical protein ACOYEC_02045 [Christensenellales bacterium]|jgi:DNA repair exonuclease SbcCD ATPase subunit|nr:hypothetical protein [Clostridiales bacterium]